MPNTPIGTLGVAPSIEIDSQLYTDIDNLILLTGFVNETSAGYWTTLRQDLEQTGLTIPANKVLVISGLTMNVYSYNNTGSILVRLGAGETDVGIASTAAPSNDQESNALVAFQEATGTALRRSFTFPPMRIASDLLTPTLPFIHTEFIGSASAAVHFNVYGYLVDA